MINISMEQVLAVLSPDEPDYQEASKLGPDAFAHLEKLVTSADPLLASKATYLTSLINSDRTISILKIASESRYPEVRIATANGIKNVTSNKTVFERKSGADRKLLGTLLKNLKNDNDVGVQKAASKTLGFIDNN